MPADRIQEVAREIRERLEDEWNIGSASAFCDESEWDSADDAEIEGKVRPILERLILEAAEVARKVTVYRTTEDPSSECADEILCHFGLEGGDE